MQIPNVAQVIIEPMKLDGYLPQEATVAAATRYGQKYEIRATLVGPANRSAGVVSVWIVRTGENVLRFVTAYPEG